MDARVFITFFTTFYKNSEQTLRANGGEHNGSIHLFVIKRQTKK